MDVAPPPSAAAPADVRGSFYTLTEDAVSTRAALRQLLLDRHDPRAVHDRIVGDVPFDEGLWNQLVRDFGIAAVVAPPSIGGLGLGHVEFGVVAGEMGAVLYTGPFWGTAVLGMAALLAVVDDSAVAADLAGRAAAGNLRLSVAYRHVDGGPRVEAARLSGRARLVVDAGASEVILVATGGEAPMLHAVRTVDATVHEVESIDPTRRLYDVDFDDAVAELVVSGPDASRAVEAALRAARLAAAAEAVRGAEEALNAAVEQAKQREQFGKPIGSFQAVKHKCADGLILVQAAKASLAYACAALDAKDERADLALAAAKAAATEAFVTVAADAIQIHGTFGYTRDAVVQSYFRRARWLSLVDGSPDDERLILASAALAQPPLATGAELFSVGMPADDDPRRQQVRAWLASHPQPTGGDLLDAGYMVPHWPAPHGIGADGPHGVIIDQELRRAGVDRPPYPLARDFVAPLLAMVGTPDQQERYTRPMLTGEEIWCELFSEPQAGSDLASLQTRAIRTETGYVVNGVKIWTSQARLAQYGLLLARTDPTASKHRSISCFVVPMDARGVSLQPILSMEGEEKWSMTYLDEVELTFADLVGAENDGWRTALNVLANERLSMSATPGLLWGEGPSFADLLAVAQRRNVDSSLPDHLRQRLMRGYEQAQALHVMRMQAAGRLGYETSGSRDVVPEVRRALADAHGQSILELWRDLHGVDGVAHRPVGDAENRWAPHYFAARSLTLGGGTSEIQRNILGERVLGLPRG